MKRECHEPGTVYVYRLNQPSLMLSSIFARPIQDLEDGVFLNIGSAVTGPEVKKRTGHSIPSETGPTSCRNPAAQLTSINPAR